MDKPLSLVEHLSELRKRIIVCLIAIGIGSVCSLPFALTFLKILKLPSQGIIEKLVFFSPQEGFIIYMHIAIVCGFSISMPVILYELWQFVSPAVEKKYKKYTVNFIISCLIVFIIGCLFAYFILIPPALKFLLSFARDELEPVISASKYISFVSSLILGCGLVFQMPTLSLLFTKLGVINYRILRKKYKYAIVVIFIVAAIITPTVDVFNMLILAIPILFLYEISIWLSFLVKAK